MSRTSRDKQPEAVVSVVPALGDGPYSSRLSARSALYTDLGHMLAAAKAAGPAPDYRRLVIDDNCLAKASEASRRKTWKELKARYILDMDHPLFAGFAAEWERCSSEQERGLTAYCLLALNDKLVADLAFTYLFPRLRRAPADLRVDDILSFLTAAAGTHPEVKAWSESTTTAVAQKYTASVRDFGLAKGTVQKVTVRPALYAAPARLLVRALRLVGARELEIVSSPLFKLLALDAGEVVDALSELSRQGALRFRMQGDVVELDLRGEN